MRRASRKAEPALVELIPSRWDDEPIPRSQSALRGLGSVDGFSLELAATSSGVRFYIRAASAEVMEQVRAQLGAAYPLADLKHVPLTDRPTLDPLWRGHNEAGAAVHLRLQRGSDLPLVADWRDRGDPLAGLLAAASALGHGKRVVCQTVL